MRRRQLLQALPMVLAACARSPEPAPPPAADAAPRRPANPPAALDADAPATALAARLARGELSARALTQFYLERIGRLDRQGPVLHAVLEIHPEALAQADALDRERAAGRTPGKLHGLPVLIKDNIETRDRMMTTAGSRALEGWYAPDDAPLVARLRAAGAVILGKSNLSEWANIRSTHSSSGWSARGGQCRNARDPLRSPSGSSSGSAVGVAAGLCALAVGTETDGSIVSPASVNGIVGLKPTLGLVSRRGIVPIAHSQDTAGPMARSVGDAALLLDVLCARDPQDPGAAPDNRFGLDYAGAAAGADLRGARLGVLRSYFKDNAGLDALLDASLQTLRTAGAEIVDALPFTPDPKLDAAELEVLLYELKADLDAWMMRLPPGFRVRSLADVIRFDREHADVELAPFGQELFERAQAKGSLQDAAYRQARAYCVRVARGTLDTLRRQHRVDALLSLTGGPAWLIDTVNGDAFTGSCSTYPAVAGYPHLTVPAAMYRGLPVGLSFIGGAFDEARLLRLGAAFETARGPLPALRAPA